MIDVNVTRDKVEAFKDNLKIGAKVNYRTPVYSLEDSSRYAKVDNEAVIVQKLKNVAIVEYKAARGKGTAVTTAAMPYKEIYLQKMGYQY
jgi:hypothetical protein